MKTTTFKVKTINEVALVQLKKKDKTKQKTNTDRTSPGVPRAGDGAPRAPQSHRRTGNFLPVGAVTHLPKKFLQVPQLFTKQSNRNEGHTMQQHRPY